MGIVLLVGSVLVIATIVTLTLARKDKPPTGSSTVRQSLKSPMADNLPKKRISSVHINNAKIVRQESKSKSEDFKTPEVRNLAIEYKAAVGIGERAVGTSTLGGGPRSRVRVHTSADGEVVYDSLVGELGERVEANTPH